MKAAYGRIKVNYIVAEIIAPEVGGTPNKPVVIAAGYH